jgi:hypothetical protein
MKNQLSPQTMDTKKLTTYGVGNPGPPGVGQAQKNVIDLVSLGKTSVKVLLLIKSPVHSDIITKVSTACKERLKEY